jgi:hypothetical protein
VQFTQKLGGVSIYSKYIDVQTALYYMNYKSNEIDENLFELLEKGKNMLAEVIKPKYCSLEINPENPVIMGEDVHTFLQGSSKIFLFAATLGAAADKLISKTQITNPTLSFVLDALADTAIENFCDEIESSLKNKLTSRFSPGYGDYPITAQPQVLSLLQAPKKIGLSVTDTYILIPRKSVTALVGCGQRPPVVRELTPF